MKKTYNKLSSDVLLVETEGSCLVVASVVEQPYSPVETTGHELSFKELNDEAWNNGNWND